MPEFLQFIPKIRWKIFYFIRECVVGGLFLYGRKCQAMAGEGFGGVWRGVNGA